MREIIKGDNTEGLKGDNPHKCRHFKVYEINTNVRSYECFLLPFSAESGLLDTRVTPLDKCDSEEFGISVPVLELSGISELSSLNIGFDGSYDVCDTDEDVSEWLSLLEVGWEKRKKKLNN